jgi:hypothetical protein
VTDGIRAPRVPRWRALNPSLAAALVLFAAWVLLAFGLRVGAGWVHLPMAFAVILMVRRVVTGPAAW